MDTYPLRNLVRPRCAERAKPGRGKPVLRTESAAKAAPVPSLCGLGSVTYMHTRDVFFPTIQQSKSEDNNYCLYRIIYTL